MKKISKLGIGPMSPEIIEAVFKYSQEHNEPLMLITSRNQVDWNGGYVNNWTTKQYVEHLDKLRKKFPAAQVYVCRDHCGPGFKDDSLKSVYRTIEADIENGFDLIHIDFCRYKGGKGEKKEILRQSRKAIEYIQKKNPDILIEIGTDENKGEFLKDSFSIEKEIKFFIDIAPIHFFVVQTGSLIKEINQVGKFNYKFIKKIRKIADKYKVNLKEHNADYLDSKRIKRRKGLIDAVNVAPQYGVIQTNLTIQKCLTYGIDFSEFLDKAYKSKRWKKWLYKNNDKNRFLCAIIAGHYVFASSAYKRIYEQINKYEDFKKSIINEIMKNFKLYLNNL